MKGPLSQVLDAFAGPARSVAEIQRATGLSDDLVEAAIDHLTRTGRLRAVPLASGCPADACGGCALVARGCPRPATGLVRPRTIEG